MRDFLARVADYRDALGAPAPHRLGVQLWDVIFVHKVFTMLGLLAWCMTPRPPSVLLLSLMSAIHLYGWIRANPAGVAWTRRVSVFGLGLFWLATFAPHVLVLVLAATRTDLMPLQAAYAPGLMWAIGLTLVTWTDMRKRDKRPDELLTRGLWAFSRAPNYLGEVLIYSAYAMFLPPGLGWLGALAVTWMVCAVMAPELARRDRHMEAKYGETWRSYLRWSA